MHLHGKPRYIVPRAVLLLLASLQVDFVARYLRGWRIQLPCSVHIKVVAPLCLANALPQVDYVARYLRGWRIPLPQLPGLQGLAEVHELHPEPFGGIQVRVVAVCGTAVDCVSMQQVWLTSVCASLCAPKAEGLLT
jgi:hypothetical protein